MTSCCVVGCMNNRANSKGFKYYNFSTQYYKKPQRDLWIKAVKRVNPDGSPWQPSRTAVICSAHFVGGQKSDHPKSPSFVPTIFPSAYGNGKESEKAVQNSRNRFQGIRLRQQIKLASNKRKILEKGAARSEEKEERSNSMTILGNEECSNFPKQSSDQGIQCNFLPEEGSDSIFFMCNRLRDGQNCEAETQTYIPCKIIVEKKVLTEDKCCGKTVEYTNAQAGPDHLDPDDRSLLKCNDGFHGYRTIRNDQDAVDLTGLTLETFTSLIRYFTVPKMSKLSKENCLLIFLMKMKLGITFAVLGILFGTHRTTILRIFYSVLQELTHNCKDFIQWPARTKIQALMPGIFKDYNPNVRVMIDCTEISVEQPSDVLSKEFLFPQYKKDFRVRILVGCAPHGLISFVSVAYEGPATDSQITTQSSLLDLLEPGDVVLADKGFPQIKTLMEQSQKGVLVVIPPFLRDDSLHAEKVEETQIIDSIRIHVEQIIQRIKTFKILSKFSVSMLPFADDIIHMCCALVNLQPNIVRNEDSVE